jgi:hypothetical protein
MESQQEIAAALIRLGAATLGESGGLVTDPRLRPAWSGAALAGPAYPVGCTPGDNLAVHVAVTAAPVGSVLVVEVSADAGQRVARPACRRSGSRRTRCAGPRCPGGSLRISPIARRRAPADGPQAASAASASSGATTATNFPSLAT